MGYPRDPDLDFLLTMALELHDADLCECGCGHYRDICQSDDMDGGYEVVDDEVVCHAKAAMDVYRREVGKREVEDGALVWVRPVSHAEAEDAEHQRRARENTGPPCGDAEPCGVAGGSAALAVDHGRGEDRGNQK